MIYFVHVPKTAGTSMRRLICHGAAPSDVTFIYMPPAGIELSTLDALSPQARQGIKILYGHFPYGVHRRLGRPGTYLTCLRETASRLVSSYYQHVRGGFVGDMGYAAYFSAWQPKDMDNYTTRLLAGVGHEVPFGGMTRVHLAQAQHNLLHGFAAFGLYEYMDETLRRLAPFTGGGAGQVGHENTTPPAQKATTIPAAEQAIVLRHNALDVELYAFAKDVFLRRHEQVAD
jgi:hypothetical protein